MKSFCIHKYKHRICFLVFQTNWQTNKVYFVRTVKYSVKYSVKYTVKYCEYFQYQRPCRESNPRQSSCLPLRVEPNETKLTSPADCRNTPDFLITSLPSSPCGCSINSGSGFNVVGLVSRWDQAAGSWFDLTDVGPGMHQSNFFSSKYPFG